VNQRKNRIRVVPTAFPYLFFIFSFFAAAYTHSQPIMDTVDSLTVAKATAFARVKDGYFPDALSAAENSLKMAEDLYGPTHQALVPYLIDLATIDRYMARYTEAESTLKWGLALREKALDPDDPLIADSCLQLASLYEDWGKWGDAEYWCLKTRAILQKQLVESSPELCETTQLLARIELSQEKLREAQALLDQNLHILEKSPSDPAIRIESLTLLAKVHMVNKHFSEAETCLQKALETVEKSFPADSVQRGDALENLGDFYLCQNKQEKAQPPYQSALKIYKQFVGSYFGYSSLPYLEKLAHAYQSVGDDQSALDLWEKDLKTTQETFGDGHPKTAKVIIQLARVERKLGKNESSQKHFNEGVKILEAFYPKDYPYVLQMKTRFYH
jgi:tetratricopeptide (TPR) repeat protein